MIQETKITFSVHPSQQPLPNLLNLGHSFLGDAAASHGDLGTAGVRSWDRHMHHHGGQPALGVAEKVSRGLTSYCYNEYRLGYGSIIMVTH